MIISFDGPMDLPNTIKSGQAFRWRQDGKETEAAEAWFSGVVFDSIVTIRHVRGGIEIRCATGEAEEVAPLLRNYLRLNDPLDDICRSIDLDEHIRSAMTRYSGMRLLRQDPWECLVSFICSATSNIRRISGNVEEMASHFGRRLANGGDARHAFPRPGELAEAGEQRLRDLGLGFRAKYLAPVARMVADGEVDLFALREADYSDGLETLTSLPGVGDKVANCVLLFSLDKLEAFPVDVWVRRALQEWYDVDRKKKLSDVDQRRWAQDYFGSYAGYANQYLFHSRRLMGR